MISTLTLPLLTAPLHLAGGVIPENVLLASKAFTGLKPWNPFWAAGPGNQSSCFSNCSQLHSSPRLLCCMRMAFLSNAWTRASGSHLRAFAHPASICKLFLQSFAGFLLRLQVITPRVTSSKRPSLTTTLERSLWSPHGDSTCCPSKPPSQSEVVHSLICLLSVFLGEVTGTRIPCAVLAAGSSRSSELCLALSRC